MICIKFTRHSKRKGAALLAIVLMGFIMLSIISAVAMNLAWKTLRMESWQTKNIQTRRLDAIVRSSIIAVAETISADGTLDRFASPEKFEDGKSITTTAVLLVDDPEKVWLSFTLKGTSSTDYTVTATASPDDGEKVTQKFSLSMNEDEAQRTWGKSK